MRYSSIYKTDEVIFTDAWSKLNGYLADVFRQKPARNTENTIPIKRVKSYHRGFYLPATFTIAHFYNMPMPSNAR